MKQTPWRIYKFGPFLLDERERQLTCEGRQIALTPKAFDTLLLLAQHSGHILGKQEMMERIWPDSFVEEATLAQNIFTLRRALGEGATNIQYIETVPRKGYRFICTVEICDKDEPAPASAGSGAALPTIAVLPFDALIHCEEEEYLGLGLADALVTKLSNLSQIVVRPTSSTRKYAAAPRDPVQAGKELSVDCVLTGSFQRAGSRIRATVQLVSVENGAVVWSDKVDDVFTDVFSIQDMISEQVSRTFLLTLTNQEKTQITKRITQNHDAYLHYLKGRYYWNKWTKESFEKGISHFRQATQIDPDFALAYVGLAEAYSTLAFYSYLSPQMAFHESSHAVQKAIQIDPMLAEAHVALAIVNFFYNWDWAAAEREFVKAIGLSPRNASLHHSYGSFLIAMGRFEEAIPEMQCAAKLDPLSPLIYTSLGYPYYFARRHEEAIEHYHRALGLDQYFPLAYKALGDAYMETGRYEEAIEEYHKAIKLLGRYPGPLSYLGRAYALAERGEEARQIIQEIETIGRHIYVSPTALSIVYLGLGEKARALDHLEMAYHERCNNLVYLQVQPTFDALRASPRFAELLARIGFKAPP